jgi:hypothetical protein
MVLNNGTKKKKDSRYSYSNYIYLRYSCSISYYISFTLTHKEGRDIKICYFCAKEHLTSYLIRLKLKKGEYTIEPTKARNAS